MTLQDFILSASNLFCPRQKGLLAVSGGLDSSVLCHIMAQARFPFAIAHCNFHLRPGDCDRDEQFVRSLAQRYGVDLYVEQFDTLAYASQQHLSVEEAARNLRYRFFREVVEGKHSCESYGAPDSFPLEYIATAHHRDDATETFFLNLLRGTGLSGLHGIPARNGLIVRPLLPFGRDELVAYAEAEGLQHVEDYTNASTAYRRNQVRHQLMPLLRQLAPDIDRTMQRTIAHLSDAEQVYLSAIQTLRDETVSEENGYLSIPILRIETFTPQRTLLFELLRPYGFTAAVVDDLLAALRSQSGIQYLSPTHRLVKDRTHLLITPLQETLQSLPTIERRSQRLTLPDGGQLILTLIDKPIGFQPDRRINVATFDADRLQWPLHLRHWIPADRFRPFGMKGSQLVSDYFSDHKFTLLQKEQTLLLCDASNAILWIMPHRVADYRVSTSTTQVLTVEYLDKK